MRSGKQGRKPMGLILRLYDNWMPLLAVADTAGGEWPKWVRIAAGWFVAKAADAPSIKVELVLDLVAVMDGEEKMTSEDIVKALGDIADRPWADWKRGKPINQVQVARMLRAFGIKSQNLRIGGKVVKGYYTADIVAAQVATHPLLIRYSRYTKKRTTKLTNWKPFL